MINSFEVDAACYVLLQWNYAPQSQSRFVSKIPKRIRALLSKWVGFLVNFFVFTFFLQRIGRCLLYFRVHRLSFG